MNNSLENLEIRVIDTPTGKSILSCQHDNKHYRGFVNEKNIDASNGNSGTIKTATLTLCNYQNCKVCDGKGNVQDKPGLKQ